MIVSQDDLRITQEQLARVEAALLSLKETVWPHSRERFRMLAEGYADQMEALRSEIDEYLGITSLIESRSELVLALEGGRIVPGEARGSLLSQYIERLRKGLQVILEAISGGSGEERAGGGRRPQWIEGLSDFTVLAMTRGSVKLHLGPPEAADIISGLEEFHKSVQLVMRGVEWAADEAERPDTELADDPRIRKAVLLAVQRLVPPNGSAVESVAFSGSAVGDRSGLRLTRRAAPRLKRAIRPMGDTEEYTDVQGVIRELDLDKNTLSLRVSPQDVPGLLCNYDELLEPDAIACLDARVIVTGTLKTNAKNGSQTMDIETIEKVEVLDSERCGDLS